MTTRIDAAFRTNASVKRLRLPLTRIERKQQTFNVEHEGRHCPGPLLGSPVYDLFAIAHARFARRCSPLTTGLRLTTLDSCDCSGVKFCGSSDAAVGSRFFNYNGLTGDVN